MTNGLTLRIPMPFNGYVHGVPRKVRCGTGAQKGLQKPVLKPFNVNSDYNWDVPLREC